MAEAQAERLKALRIDRSARQRQRRRWRRWWLPVALRVPAGVLALLALLDRRAKRG